MKRYDITKPRFTVHGLMGSFEVLHPGEVSFWKALGYIVTEARWDGRMFKEVK